MVQTVQTTHQIAHQIQLQVVDQDLVQVRPDQDHLVVHQEVDKI